MTSKAWPSVALGEIAEIVTGTTPSTLDRSNYGGEVPFITPTELVGLDPITNSRAYLSKGGVGFARLLPEESVLVCCIGSLGKVGIAGVPLVTNQQINALIPNRASALPRYLLHACTLLKKRLEMIAPATTLKIVNKSRLAELEIPLPPLDKQRQIAAILDKAYSLRQMRRLALRKFDAITESIFLDMFGDPRLNLHGHARVTTDSVCDLITDGEHLTPKRTTEGIKLLSARNIQNGYLDFTDVDYIDEDEYTRITARCKPRRDDVLVSCSGTIGRVSAIRTDEPLALVRSAALLRPNQSRVRTGYLEAWLQLPWMTGMMKQRANASSQANLFQNQIRDLPVLTPNVSEQDEFIATREKVFTIQDCYRGSVAQMDAMFLSLQHRAFKGEL